MIRTENLTIIFVDIAGFTATTSRQSRAENARLLQTFDKTLLPLIKRYKGKLIKTIGDALLITFRSPTDAMLCSMALQDAMHAHNLSVKEEEKIHIRVAANLGEVRITKSDIFGEPVNVASRIEGIAPADEIYLSEAVYMAMNKAEVPAKEVGYKELAGITQPVRVYNIPRFSTHILVAENIGSDEQGNELLYPYGGMHYQAPPGGSTRLFITTLVVCAVAVALVLGYRLIKKTTTDSPAMVETVINEAKETVTKEMPTKSDGTEAPSVNTTETTSMIVSEQPKPAPISEQKSPVVNDKTSKSSTDETDDKLIEPADTANKEDSIKWDLIKAGIAYKAKKITKTEYNYIVRKIKADYEREILQLKIALSKGEITPAEYKKEVTKTRLKYGLGQE